MNKPRFLLHTCLLIMKESFNSEGGSGGWRINMYMSFIGTAALFSLWTRREFSAARYFIKPVGRLRSETGQRCGRFGISSMPPARREPATHLVRILSLNLPFLISLSLSLYPLHQRPQGLKFTAHDRVINRLIPCRIVERIDER